MGNTNSMTEVLLKLQAQLDKALIVKTETIRLILVSLLCRGHLLLEDVPGLGKTTLAKALANSLSLNFKRIQCTPDLMPTDITGLSIFDQKAQGFRFLPGPIFTNILLADEINRTSPRTQSALLEAMAERTVTIDRKTRPLPSTFMVIATQNPVEFSGTYPLPEAQLDRFFMRISLGYPSLENEVAIMRMNQAVDPVSDITAVLGEDVLIKMQEVAQKIKIDTKLMHYIAAIVQATRQHKSIRLGASPRGAIALMKAVQAMALVNGNTIVTAQMVQDIVPAVLAHRILLRSGSDHANRVLEEILKNTPVPSMPSASVNISAPELALDESALELSPK